MLIDKYIENALYLYQCVIVPGFGGFLAVEKDASTDPDTGKVTPASRVFSFNSSLKVNDGVLASYIANMRDISYSEALIEISRGVDYYLSRLSKGDAVDIAGVGMIKPADSGEWVFTAYGEKSFSRENYGLDTGIITPCDDTPSEEKVEQEEKTSVIPVVDLAGEKEEDKEPEEEPSISWEKPQVEEEPARTGRTGRMVWYILTAVVLMMCILIYATKDAIKDYFSPSEPVKVEHKQSAPVSPELAAVVIKDTIQTDTTQVVEKAKEKPQEVEDWDARFEPHHRYYIVAVSLSIEENARKELERLKKEGYPAVFAGRQSGLYMVAYGAFDSRDEMMIMYDSIRTHHNDQVWVKVYNQIPKK